MRRALLLLPALLSPFGCTRTQPAAPVDAAPIAAPTPPPLPPPLPPIVTAQPPAPPPTAFAEVEIVGRLVLPKGLKDDVHILVCDGPCFRPGSRAYHNQIGGPENFFVEVFVPQGTKLWLAAAAVPKRGKPVYTAERVGPLLGQGLGEVMHTGQLLTLKKGPPVALPPPRPIDDF